MAIIDLLGRLLDRIMNQDNTHTFDRTTDSLEAISNAIWWLIVTGGGRPEMDLYEGWQDELGIDFTLWTVTHPTVGVWVRGAGAGVAAPFLRATAPLLLNETSQLVGNQRWQIAPDTWGTNTIVRQTVLEFEFTTTLVANLDNAVCFWGFTPAQADDRASNNIIGFGLLADVVQAVTDLAAAETVTAIAAADLATYNKFRMEILAVAGVGTVLFYLNEVLVATHITNLPDLPMYPNFQFDTEGTGGAVPQIGVVRIWHHDAIIP